MNKQDKQNGQDLKGVLNEGVCTHLPGLCVSAVPSTERIAIPGPISSLPDLALLPLGFASLLCVNLFYFIRPFA